MTKKLPPISLEQILFKEFMEPMNISHSKLARNIDVPITRINNIIKHHRSITVDTALRLGKYFNINPRWGMNMQNQYDLEIAKNQGWKAKEQRIRTFAIAS